MEEKNNSKNNSKSNSKSQYRGLSTAAAKCAAFGRDDGICGSNKQASGLVLSEEDGFAFEGDVEFGLDGGDDFGLQGFDVGEGGVAAVD